MIDLTNTAAIYARAREAYANKELQAQNPGNPLGKCSYHGPCAIGVYLTPEQRNEVEPKGYSFTISNLLHDNMVRGEEGPLMSLQNAHDRWNTEVRNGYSAESIAEREADFVRISKGY